MSIERKWAEFTSSPSPRAVGGLYVSLNERGILFLSRKVHEALEKPVAVLFYYDIDNLSIGLKPCDLLMPNAFPLAQRGKTRSQVIRALPFMRANKIFPTGTIRFLNPVVEKGMLVLDLNHTARTTQSPRVGWRKKNQELPNVVLPWDRT